MSTLAQIRGGILEEIILILLENAGYRILDESDGEKIRKGPNGLELQGRGEWHQVDALVAYDFLPSFIYPIRLIVETKAYLPKSRNRGRIGIGVIRNAVGVLKDVNENFFSYSSHSKNNEYKFSRFNYVYSVFSLCGFTKNAQRYAIAHQIFLFQYHFNPLFEDIKNLIFQVDNWELFTKKNFELAELRRIIRDYLQNKSSVKDNLFTDKGKQMIRKLKEELDKIKGSYFGLLNGEYPIHLVSEKPLNQIQADEILSEIHINKARYVTLEFNNNKLYFELPEVIAKVFLKIWSDKVKIAKTKKEYISYITLTGKIEGIRRSLVIKLDKNWLDEYLKNIINNKEAF